MSFGALVEEARLRLGISQEELASRIGVSRVSVSRIESDVRGMSVEVLHRLIRELGLDAAQAIGLAAQASQEHASSVPTSCNVEGDS